VSCYVNADAPPNADASHLRLYSIHQQSQSFISSHNLLATCNCMLTCSCFLFSVIPLQIPRPAGIGSGFVYDYDGHIVTNAHVVGSAREVSATLADGQVVKAKVVGLVREKDLAVLKLQGLTPEQEAGLKPVVLGSSSNLLVRDASLSSYDSCVHCSAVMACHSLAYACQTAPTIHLLHINMILILLRALLSAPAGRPACVRHRQPLLS
jgi:S1-C subfamily serine protease